MSMGLLVLVGGGMMATDGSENGSGQCWDIFVRNTMIDDCTASVPCSGGCNNFEDIRPGTKYESVTSDPSPMTIICYPGKVTIDQNGACQCSGLNLNMPQSRQVGKLIPGLAC